MKGALLALDLGLKTGWACGVPGAVVSGVTDMKESRFESHGVRFVNFLLFLTKLHTAMDIKEVVYEEVRRHRGTDAAHAYGGFLSQLQTWCLGHGIPYRSRTVQEVKKSATGKGNASKEDVMAAMSKLGHKFKDDNEADALSIFELEAGDWRLN
jgi:Holliday junction resolvasome RuvABC endonuclease subunit